jgi:hypothetical protein
MTALPYRVECKAAPRPYYELIAAFDCQQAAEAYAGECALANMALDYRVKKGKLLLRQYGPNE